MGSSSPLGLIRRLVQSGGRLKRRHGRRRQFRGRWRVQRLVRRLLRCRPSGAASLVGVQLIAAGVVRRQRRDRLMVSQRADRPTTTSTTTSATATAATNPSEFAVGQRRQLLHGRKHGRSRHRREVAGPLLLVRLLRHHRRRRLLLLLLLLESRGHDGGVGAVAALAPALAQPDDDGNGDDGRADGRQAAHDGANNGADGH